MTLIEAALQRLRKVLEEVGIVVAALNLSRRDQQHLAAGAYLATVLRLSDGVARALEGNNATSGFILLRSVLEAYIDLKNIVHDKMYINNILAGSLREQIRYLRETGQKESLGDKEKELQSLKDSGHPPLSAKDRVSRAGETDSYCGKYWYLCLHSHNNLTAVEERHIQFDGEGDAISIVVFEALSENDSQLIVDTLAEIAAYAVGEVKRLQDGGTPTGLDEVDNALADLRKLWQSAEPLQDTGKPG